MPSGRLVERQPWIAMTFDWRSCSDTVVLSSGQSDGGNTGNAFRESVFHSSRVCMQNRFPASIQRLFPKQRGNHMFALASTAVAKPSILHVSAVGPASHTPPYLAQQHESTVSVAT
jgi:hypothetical protein